MMRACSVVGKVAIRNEPRMRGTPSADVIPRSEATRDPVCDHRGQSGHEGFHAVVDGGDDSSNTPHETTRVEDDVAVGDWAVVFRSTIGKGTMIGIRALVDGSQIAPGTVVPDRAIIIDNKRVGTVEW